MGLPYRDDACQHHVDHRLITSAVLRFIADLEPETGATAFQLEANRMLELLADRKSTVEALEAQIAGTREDQRLLQESLVKMAMAGDLGAEMRIVGARIQELEELTTQNQEAAEIGREYVRSLERGLEVLGVDARVELAQPTVPGTVVFDFAGLERRWRAFEEKAVLLKDALEQSDFTTARELMWLLGLHVRIDFSRPVLRDAARRIKVEMDLARLNRERPAESEAYTPYSVPEAG